MMLIPKNHPCGGLDLWRLAAPFGLSLGLVFACSALTAQELVWQRPSEQWSAADAKQILENSPWVRQQVIRNSVCGTGANREIEDIFTVRLLSAKPIRRAYARLSEIANGGVPAAVPAGHQISELEAPPDRIVVGVSFHSDDVQRTMSLWQFFRSQTTAWMKWNAVLSTNRIGRVSLSQYIPPSPQNGEIRFLFPASIKGEPLLAKRDKELRFRMWVPPNQSLRVTWDVKALGQESGVEY